MAPNDYHQTHDKADQEGFDPVPTNLCGSDVAHGSFRGPSSADHLRKPLKPNCKLTNPGKVGIIQTSQLITDPAYVTSTHLKHECDRGRGQAISWRGLNEQCSPESECMLL